MSLVVDMRPMADYLHASIRGEYTLQELKDAYVRIIDASHQHDIRNILIDGLGVTGVPTFAERFELGKFAAAQRLDALATGKRVDYRVAIAAVPPLAHPEKISVIESQRRGLPIDIFERVEDALAWLGVKPESAS